MDGIEYGNKLKFELAALHLSTDENLEMVGKCHISIKIFGDPATVNGSIAFGFPSDRKRLVGPVLPDQAALKIYDYLYRYKALEQAQQAVGKVPQDRTPVVFPTTWADGRKATGKRGPKPRAEEDDEEDDGATPAPPRRVFIMPPSEIRETAKDISEIKLEDFKPGAWVVTARAELKLAADLEVTDLPADQVVKLRQLSRKLRELEAVL